MSMKTSTQIGLAALLLAGLSAAPVLATPVTIQKFISVPSDAANVQPGGAFTSFDISYIDPVTGFDYVADRSNASVDIFSGSSLTFVGRATGFTGQQATTSASGADGVVTVTSGATTTIYAGDGNSTLKVFTAPTATPGVATLASSIFTGGTTRVDEMAYSPLTHQVLAANNAEAPAYGNLFSTTNGAPPVALTNSPIKIPGAANTDGMEQPAWNPNTGSFFVSIPAFAGDQGGVAEIKTDGTVGALTKFASIAGGPATCGPAGLAVGGSGNLMVGCGSGQAVLLHIDPTTHVGSVVALFPQISGTDELWYDPTSQSFYLTGKDTSGNRVFDIISDVSDLITQSVVLPVAAASNPHSIAVDPFNGDIFVPLAGTTFNANGSVAIANTTCPSGCIAVFGVPEPSPLPIILFGSLVLLGLAAERRWHLVLRAPLSRS